jgi:hypothetical protein
MNPERTGNRIRELINQELKTSLGAIKLIGENEPSLYGILASFIASDEQRMLLVGGESGMGKSLLTTDTVWTVKKITDATPKLVSPVAVITWDRVHRMFYDALSVEKGHTIPLPRGETHPDVRKVISTVFCDTVRFATEYFPEARKIIVEAPFIDFRGENLLREPPVKPDNVTLLVMHSPKLRNKVMSEGRIKDTSGQPPAMKSIRENLLKSILGNTYTDIPIEKWDEIVKKYWENLLRQLEISGKVIEWDPDIFQDDGEELQLTTERFKSQSISPDQLKPIELSKFTKRYIESVLSTVKDLPEFLDKAEEI